ncbi:MAG: hypothetical protein ACRC36_00190 [Lacrimispora sphenoides]
MIDIGREYIFNHKEGNVLEKYDGTKCVILKNDCNENMYIAKMVDGRSIQVYEKELS